MSKTDAQLREILARRIMILDGAMGTIIQQYKLDETAYRGGPNGAFIDFASRELAKIGLIDLHDVLDGTVVRVRKAYPAYFGAYSDIGQVRGWLDRLTNLFPVGRNGMHRYNNQDHSMLAAKAAVDCIVSGSADKSSLWSVNVEDEYHEERATSQEPARVDAAA